MSRCTKWRCRSLTRQVLRQEASGWEQLAEGGILNAEHRAGIDVTILLPAFNEEAKIRGYLRVVARALSAVGLRYEIVVIDDGSSDGTRLAAAEEMMHLPVKVVGYAVNRGKGEALKYGSRFSSGEVTVFLDSDGEIETCDLPGYIRALRDADLAIGSKKHAESRVVAPLERRFLSTGFNYLVRLLTGVRYPDTQSGLKAFRTDALRRIMALVSVKRYAFDVEILAVASLLKMRVVEMPIKIRLNARFSATSLLRMLIDLLGITYRLRIKHWYQRNLSEESASYQPILRW